MNVWFNGSNASTAAAQNTHRRERWERLAFLSMR